MRKLQYVFYVFICCVLCFSCEDAHSERGEQTELERGEEIKDFLNSVARLDTMVVSPLRYEFVSERVEDDVYRYDESDKKYDYYTPKWVTTRICGLENVSDMLVSQSGDVIWLGNIIQGKSVAVGSLAPIPLSSRRNPADIPECSFGAGYALL